MRATYRMPSKGRERVKKACLRHAAKISEPIHECHTFYGRMNFSPSYTIFYHACIYLNALIFYSTV